MMSNIDRQLEKNSQEHTQYHSGGMIHCSAQQHNQDNNRVDLGLTVLQWALQGADLNPTENIQFTRILTALEGIYLEE